MITRMQMPRQMYGLGSFVKDRIRKLIPNELASVASKAAPIVAPFNPGVAALMRGIGRFDQRGSISDALKQGIGTYAFGAGARALGGAPDITGGGLRGGFTSPLSPEKTQQFTSLFNKQAADPTITPKDLPGGPDASKFGTGIKETLKKTIKKLPDTVVAQLTAGGITAGASLLASYFQGDFREQESGETMEEYLAARKDVVGKQMRIYMDNYFANDPEYSALDDAGRNAFVARYNVRDGGRIGYQTGGISSANTLAENIARNRAAQAAFQQSLAPSRQRVVEKLKRSFPVAETLMNVAAPAINLGRGILGLQDPIGTPSMGDRMKELEATKGPTGSIGYEDYGLPVATPGGRFTGGLPKLALSNPVDFALAGSAGRYGFSPEGRTDLKYDFTPDQDTGSTGNAILDFVNQGGVKAKVSDLLTPSTAEAAETTPTPDASTDRPTMADVAGPKMVDGVSQEGIIPGFVKRRSEFYNADGTPNQEKIKAANFVTGSFPREFYYERIGEEGGFGPETYSRIAAGQYPDIYDPRANVAGGGMPMGIMRSNKAGVMERDYRDEGGFVPVGIKEKADDVPAMLSKNEFVFTADAVRGAGNGSIEKGAQKMYDTMKNLERRVV